MSTDALLNQAHTLLQLNKYVEALDFFDKALGASKDNARAWNGRGQSLWKLRRYDEAIASFDTALTLRPDSLEALFARGNIFSALGRFEEALASYEKAAALKPDLAEAAANCGNALCGLKRFDEAVMRYNRAILLAPNRAELHLYRGNLLTDMRLLEAALEDFERATTINPNYAEAWNNKGNVLRDMQRTKESLVCHDKSLSLIPAAAGPLMNRGNILRDLGRMEDAVKDYERAFAINPRFEHLEGLRLHAKMHLCDWRGYDTASKALVANTQRGYPASTPFALLALPSTPADQLLCARAYAAHRYPAQPRLVEEGKTYHHDKIRIAYLSADFHEHATAYLMAGVFEHHDRRRFETTAMSFGTDDKSKMRARLVSSFDSFMNVSRMGDGEVAKMMMEREIDIAIDLKGFTQGGRAGIFAYRGAPLQVNFIGYPGTMGAPYIDYIIADQKVIPPEMQKYYSEKVACLPDTYQSNDNKRLISPQMPSRSSLGLPEKGFVFCSFNNHYKITPDVFDIWMRLLKVVDGSVLWLLKPSETAIGNLRNEAAQRGVSAERIVFAPRMLLADHLARQRQGDLFLDTLPYNAHTTASDALWAGLPIVTCLGQTFASRVAGSLLTAAGMPELVTQSMDEYENLALKLARDPSLLVAAKRKLANMRDTCALFDTERYTRHLEAAYVKMWEKSQRGEQPESFTVERSLP